MMDNVSANNVIVFPKIKRPIPVEAAIRMEHERSEQERYDQVQHIHDELMESMVMTLNDHGLMDSNEFCDEETFTKDVALISEAFRSLITRTVGMDHPLQSVAEHGFDIDRTQKGLIVVGKINLGSVITK
jgi:hypothetical protein